MSRSEEVHENEPKRRKLQKVESNSDDEIVQPINILDALFSNPGLVHIAVRIASYLDNESMAQCRLVSKKYNAFLLNIWQERTLAEAQRLCEIELRTHENREISGKMIPTSIFQEWPEWKVALKEIPKLEDLSAVTWLLWKYIQSSRCYGMETVPYFSLQWISHSSPLHYIAKNYCTFKFDQVFEESRAVKFFEILLKTSLDFNVQDVALNTPLHNACERGAKEVVELLLNNASQKGINVHAVNKNNETIVHSAYITNHMLTDGTDRGKVPKHLFQRRMEFGFDISPVTPGGSTILHYACNSENYETLQLMLQWAREQEIDVCVIDYEGNTILHITAQNDPEMMLNLLGCNDGVEGLNLREAYFMANMPNVSGKRPIDLVKQRWSHMQPVKNQLIAELNKYNQ